jgi:hypothetical protein
MSDSIYRLHGHLRNACELLQPWRDRFITEVTALEDVLKVLCARHDKMSGEGERLSIGIMGQVKAGKSSFLNALLFGGEPVLPEAATPKTANLTRICYGVKPTLTVTWYSPEEWRQIEAAAQRGDADTEARVASALLKAAQQQDFDVGMILAESVRVIEAADVDELIGRMNDFVGENGKYTALVQMTELAIPDPALVGYEIVDTPGMNDPVPSRTEKTREYMATCDVVFFLTRCNQFLDESDTLLLHEQLPAKGVKRISLIAGQMDGAIDDDGYDRKSLTETEENIRTRLTLRAKDAMTVSANAARALGDESRARLFDALCTPVFVSTYAHLFATWPESRWSERGSMRNMHEKLNDIAHDAWRSGPILPEDWVRIGNFEQIRTLYDIARADKEKILRQQRDELSASTEKQWRQALNALREVVFMRSETLRTKELKDLCAQKAACEVRIESIAETLGNIVLEASEKAKVVRNEVCTALATRRTQVGALKRRDGTETETESYQVSASTWYKPWTWGDTETRYRTITHHYKYVAASDAIERLSDYAGDSARHIESHFNSIVQMGTLRNSLRCALFDQFDAKDKSFDPGAFRKSFERALEGIILPTLELDVSDVPRKISTRFSGRVRGDQMDELERAINDSLNVVAERLEREVGDKVSKLIDTLECIRSGLGQTMTYNLSVELVQLAEAFNHKEQEERSCSALLQEIQRIANVKDL